MRKISPPPGFDPRTVQPVADYTIHYIIFLYYIILYYMQHRLMCWHLEVFLNISLRSACFLIKALFTGKKQNSLSWEYSSEVSDCQDFRIIGLRIKGILLHFLFSCAKIHNRFMRHNVPYYRKVKKQNYFLMFSMSSLLVIWRALRHSSRRAGCGAQELCPCYAALHSRSP